MQQTRQSLKLKTIYNNLVIFQTDLFESVNNCCTPGALWAQDIYVADV